MHKPWTDNIYLEKLNYLSFEYMIPPTLGEKTEQKGKNLLAITKDHEEQFLATWSST